MNAVARPSLCTSIRQLDSEEIAPRQKGCCPGSRASVVSLLTQPTMRIGYGRSSQRISEPKSRSRSTQCERAFLLWIGRSIRALPMSVGRDSRPIGIVAKNWLRFSGVSAMPHEAFQQVGSAQYRADAVDADAGGCEFHRHRLRQDVHGAIAAIVPSEPRARPDAGNGADIDVRAATRRGGRPFHLSRPRSVAHLPRCTNG